MITPDAPDGGGPVLIDPDLDFIRALGRRDGTTLKKCFQCGTCSATCARSPDERPFPRKEMAWAVWGMKDRLLTDPDVWLCYQCDDCSTRCPRGARPGDVLGAVRQECVVQYAFPRFLARWTGQPQAALLLLAIPAALLTVVLYLKDAIGEMLGLPAARSEGIIYSYSHMFPHWLLNGFFGLISLLVLLVLVAGAARFWRAMSAAGPRDGTRSRGRPLLPSILVSLKSVLTHDRFGECDQAGSRFWSHMLVLYGFLGLTVVTLWIITAGINPLIQDPFIYPFGFFSPWKLLANAAGAAVLAGCVLMAWRRLMESEQPRGGSYFDWSLIVVLFAVVITGFITEALHYVRLEPHRHLAYFTHLVFVLALLMYIPYSKLAHAVYRTTALVYSAHTGREVAMQPAAEPGATAIETQEEEDHAELAVQ